ncbi:MAG: hypothetical protein JWN86_4704 [Planctomycetota bacterium]|nr:hypothetical protein [Planctomycetota bacterium]
MRNVCRVLLAGVACLLVAAVATGGFMWSVGRSPSTRLRPQPSRPRPSPVVQAAKKAELPADDPIEWPLEDGGVSLANLFTGPLGDGRSLSTLREAIRVRGPLAEALMRSRLDLLHLDGHSSTDHVIQGIQIRNSLALLALYDGRLEDADKGFAEALAWAEKADTSPAKRTDLLLLRGVVALRRGERDNCVACVGPSSCIFPILPEAAHTQQRGSRDAVALFTACLERRPEDLRARWLLNLAYMTLGEYPDKVPARYLVPLDGFRSKLDVGRSVNVANSAGLNTRGPNLAGGSVFDDFTGDGLPDLLTTSLDIDRGASLFVNRGDGTFEDRSAAAGLSDQVYALNVTRTDYDNDGDLDALLLRGGWERPMRMSLLRNRGDGTFEDVTLAAGLDEPITCESAAWGDFDGDGLVDVFTCGEYLLPSGQSAASGPDPRNRCRLYRNRGDGTFEDVASRAGVENMRCAKGSAWGDYDGDGRIDLYVSNMSGPSRLYHNEGDGTFRDVAPDLGVTGAEASFAV